MSKVLLLSIPSHGHMNPLLGLANELIKQGEKVTFFSSEEFRSSVESIGAKFVAYGEDMNIFKIERGEAKPKTGLLGALLQPQKFIDGVLAQIGNEKYDYLIFSAAYPYATVIAQVLGIPSVSSFAVFMPIKKLLQQKSTNGAAKGPFQMTPEMMQLLQETIDGVMQTYNVSLPHHPLELMINKGDLNIIYTSEYFLGERDEYDDSFILVGPPVFAKQYDIDFPFELLKGKQVIYISLGTMFGNHSHQLNLVLFDAFRDTPFTVVMAAHGVDRSLYDVPHNFIIRDYVPQLDLLPYLSAAITHAGMNSIGDLLYHAVPFVSIPLGADQFYLANRAAELGATIVLDAAHITPEQVRQSVDEVITNPAYRYNGKMISDSFKEAGGYARAVAEIFKLKKKKEAIY